MKIKTPAQVDDGSNTIPQDVIRHIQALTDDVRTILSGGLNMFDRQLPFQTRTVTVTSGQPVFLTMQTPYTIMGAIPIQTNNVTVTGMTTNFSGGKFSITLTMSSSTAQIVFLMIGTNV